MYKSGAKTLSVLNAAAVNPLAGGSYRGRRPQSPLTGTLPDVDGKQHHTESDVGFSQRSMLAGGGSMHRSDRG
jgi:hypothetical protein